MLAEQKGGARGGAIGVGVTRRPWRELIHAKVILGSGFLHKSLGVELIRQI